MWKISKTFKVSSSAVAKTIKRHDETGSHEDHHRKGRPRVTSAICSLGLPATEIAAQINASQISNNRHQLFRGDCMNYAFMVTKDMNKKRLAWAKKHEQWTSDRWKSILWSDVSKY
jgi:hypothetical protein